MLIVRWPIQTEHLEYLIPKRKYANFEVAFCTVLDIPAKFESENIQSSFLLWVITSKSD